MSQWPHVTSLGKIFIKLAPLLAAYGPYVENSTHAHKTLTRLLQTDQKFAAFVSERAGGSDFKLTELLFYPLNRISQYSMSFETILKHTPRKHPDHSRLSRAHGMMTKLYNFIQESVTVSKNRAKILECKRKLGAYFEGQLLAPGRVLVKEGSINVTSKGKKAQRYIFLFNDMAILTKSIQKGEMCRPKDILVFTENTKVTVGKEPHQFMIACEDTYLLESENKQVADAWRLDFSKQIEAVLSRSRNVFGVQLVEILKKDSRQQDGIPYVVRLLVKEIEKDLTVKGIYRVPGNDDVVVGLKKVLDTFEEVKNPFVKASTFDIAAALKLFLRELPEPLLTFDLYEEFTALEGSEEEKSRLKEIIAKLPKENLNLLKFIIKHLINVGNQSSTNMMTPTNLALIFGPGLLYPRVETIQYTLTLPRIFWIVQTMIEDYDAIFGEDKNQKPKYKKKPTGNKKKKIKAKATVLYQYAAQSENELNLVVGASVTVLQNDPSGWCEVRIGSESGWVPAGYLQIQSS
eukprot:TRINITY_DN7412_c0_g1_i2.p1 TRINITY_DN7412_c0_g1~~TRINITY_DN7412_c0_g1_i2.p1  ORF type:complete len:594 (-),score=95.17 TRINITY_DN7412_c0_g1_i2:41-1594(-)